MEYKRKISFWYIAGGIGAFLLLILIIYLVVSNANKAPTQVEELKPLGRREYYYEFTY